jgi:hypothetical protein
MIPRSAPGGFWRCSIEGAFGGVGDYAVPHRVYGAAPESAKGRYSPAECMGIARSLRYSMTTLEASLQITYY